MPLPSCAVQVPLRRADDSPLVGATVTAQLSQTETFLGEIAPAFVVSTTNSEGLAVLNLFPNDRGTQQSLYDVTISPADGSRGRAMQIRPVDSGAAPITDLVFSSDVGYALPLLILEDGEPLLLEDSSLLSL